jgi:RNA polymerase sigma factor (sigma-70 family)
MDGFGAMIARAKCRQAEAVAQVYELYARRVAHRVRDRLGPSLRRHYETDDITDSVFREVLRDLPDFEDRGESAFVHWLCIKAENKVREKARRHLRPDGRGRQTEFPDDADGALRLGSDPPEGRLVEEEERRILRALVDTLDPLDAAIVTLHVDEGLTFADIAARHVLASADAARKRYARAILALQARTRASPPPGS